MLDKTCRLYASHSNCDGDTTHVRGSRSTATEEISGSFSLNSTTSIVGSLWFNNEHIRVFYLMKCEQPWYSSRSWAEVLLLAVIWDFQTNRMERVDQEKWILTIVHLFPHGMSWPPHHRQPRSAEIKPVEREDSFGIRVLSQRNYLDVYINTQCQFLWDPNEDIRWRGIH